MHSDILLTPGTLRGTLDERIRSAIADGALQPIATGQEIVEDGGVRFLVRVVSSLRRKEADKRQRAAKPQDREKPANPFLPPEPELTVAEISGTHLAVLNKFNVLDRHLLIVTRRFEHQEELLGVEDFQALFACMAEYRGLGFYNGGNLAGASQPHKHLQLVPLPLAEAGSAVPVEPLLMGPGPRCAALPYPHAFARLGRSIALDPMAHVPEVHAIYLDLLERIGISAVQTPEGQRQSAPYNLLIAEDWLLAVPRVKELFQGVSINALGFVGSLFVRDKAQLDLVRMEGPMRILQAVSGGAA